ncbi:hypothetical protein RRG08_003490 [Elysia crispata]|uniref:Uncharacterized protein n=1 Tax=Elysia crispata TaxID=231223 RepID=A0AAE0Y6D4_9GAST|nr:hypothetical protein RRG08_003490 [Elysia crispata]
MAASQTHQKLKSNSAAVFENPLMASQSDLRPTTASQVLFHVRRHRSHLVLPPGEFIRVPEKITPHQSIALSRLLFSSPSSLLFFPPPNLASHLL